MANEPTEKTISRLESAFGKARSKLKTHQNGRGTPLHKAETEFLFLVQEIRSAAPDDRDEKVNEAWDIINNLS